MLGKKQFKTIIDLVQVFPDEKSCHLYLASQRWEDGVIICPHCEHDKAYVFTDSIRYKCQKCKLKFTAKTDTFMEASKLPTIKWLMAMYLVLHKKGISSIQLSKDIGVTQKTAWFVMHRVRWALGQQEQPELSGTVQLDETFVGGKNKNRHADKKVKNSQGRSFKDKTPVMGMLQQQVTEIVSRPHKVIAGKIVKEKVIIEPSVLICHVVPDTKSESLQPIIRRTIKPGSILVSDEWFAYKGLNDVYSHNIVDHAAKEYVNADGLTSNALEGAWTQLKRQIIGCYHKTTRKHLHRYVNEFEFRYNNRTLGPQQQIEHIISNMECRLKYKDLIAA